MKYQAPQGCCGICVAGQSFNVDAQGQIEVPDEADIYALIAPHGFTPVAAIPAPAPVAEPAPVVKGK